MPSLISVANSPAFLDPDAGCHISHVFLDAIPTIRALPVHPHWAEIEEITSENWRSPSMARSASRKQCSERTFARGNILNKSRLFQRGISFRSQTIALLMPYLLGALLLILLPSRYCVLCRFHSVQRNRSTRLHWPAKFSTPESRSALLGGDDQFAIVHHDGRPSADPGSTWIGLIL